jgi:hypothetical protein
MSSSLLWWRPGFTRTVMFRVVFAIAVALVAVACGSHATTTTRQSGRAVAHVDRPVPGAPNTPRWLRIRIWDVAHGLGDPDPTKVVVRLRLHERGRVVDRVWMRGDFICTDCSYPPGGKPPRGHVAGFTVLDTTQQGLSFSLSHG